MNNSFQLNIPPMSLPSVKSADLNALKSIQSVTLAELVVSAGVRLGMQKKEIAALFDLSGPDFSAAFDVVNPKNAERNRLMKIPLPLDMARQVALQLCEATGLAVGGPDMERHALAELLKACSDYIRVVSR